MCHNNNFDSCVYVCCICVCVCVHRMFLLQFPLHLLTHKPKHTKIPIHLLHHIEYIDIFVPICWVRCSFFGRSSSLNVIVYQIYRYRRGIIIPEQSKAKTNDVQCSFIPVLYCMCPFPTINKEKTKTIVHCDENFYRYFPCCYFIRSKFSLLFLFFIIFFCCLSLLIGGLFPSL